MVSCLSGQFPRQSFLTPYHLVQMCISENEAYPESTFSWGNRINKQRVWGMFYSLTNKLKWCFLQSCQKHTRHAMQPCWEGSKWDTLKLNMKNQGKMTSPSVPKSLNCPGTRTGVPNDDVATVATETWATSL